MNINQKDITRFFSATKQNHNGCLEWTKSLTYNGYGRFSVSNEAISAHRFAWIIKYGNIPHDLLVCHSCDNRKCVNWKHLWLGTPFLNSKDRNLKNRQRKRLLSPSQEEEIALAFYTSITTQKELAIKYNTTRETIAKTIRFKHFKDKYGKKTVKKPKKITSEIREEIIKRRSLGETTEDLAKEFNVTPGAIRYNLNIFQYRNTFNKSQRIRRAKLRF